MNKEEIKNFLNNFHDKNKLNESYKFEDALNFLLNSKYEKVPIISYAEGIWINSIIVPKTDLPDNYIEKLLEWNIFTSSYSYWTSNDKFRLSEPCESYKPHEILAKATPIFLERDIFNHTATSIEINQKISHRLDIAEFKEKNHFYKLDKYGDKIEVASITKDNNITLCLLNKKELDNYLNISDSVLIRFFNISILEEPHPLDSSTNIVKLDADEIYYKNHTQYSNLKKPTFREIRGFQIIRNDEKLEDEEKINYQNFKVLNLKTGEVTINSCNPNRLGNPFVKSEYIDEISPAFFRTDVFKKYHDSDKYLIDNRYIECKGVWSLRYSLSDDKSQVIVYIKDLGGLPEYEQIYWKSFNVEPKSKISEHIFRTDFLGEWDDVIDPLKCLKECLNNFPSCKIEGEEIKIWIENNKKNIRTLDNLQYIKHPTKEIWEFEVKKLHQLIVEGLVGKNIDIISKKLNCYESNLKPLKQLKKCINTLYSNKVADYIMDPLIKLNKDRNTIEHANNENNYPNDFIQDYNDRIKSCYISMTWLSNKIKKGIFDFD